ncbi:hypothetical protein SDC9_189332 [bioreactor metagenome]|uniref:Uncharacterized protein n=1 Tax=bioreactor metagenome TaxID=1076179 RepID=A0A645HS69_9ZZZZ
MALSFEIEHRIHHMLQNARACDSPLFGYMANNEYGAARGFCQAGQKGRGLPHLAHATRNARTFRAIHGLNGVYN